MFPTGCPTCDQHGPELDAVLSGYESLAFHRAAHDAARTIGQSFEDVAETIAQAAARFKELQRPAEITPRRRT